LLLQKTIQTTKIQAIILNVTKSPDHRRQKTLQNFHYLIQKKTNYHQPLHVIIVKGTNSV